MRRVIAWTLSIVLFSAQLGDLAYAQVVTDGLTDTHVATTGSVTNVTTGTVYGETGVNSFAHFNVAQDHTVNLHLPTGTSSLVNFVNQSASEIYGTVNAVQNQTDVGGRLYFVNPYGITIGPSGVINAGAVTLMTPKLDWMHDDEYRLGILSPGKVNAVLSGNVPISSSGNISVQGTINAATDVHLAAGTVDVSGTVLSGAVFQSTRPDLSDIVNINGLDRNPRVAFENGVVRIEAEDSVHITGTVAAHGVGNTDAGDIEVSAGRAIELGPGALLRADVENVEGGSAANQGKPGAVTLLVSRTNDEKTPTVSWLDAETRIVLDGATVKAGQIALTAEAAALNAWDPTDPRDILRSTVSVLEGIMLENINVLGARARSEVILKGNTVLSTERTGSVTLTADSVANLELMSVGTSSSTMRVADLGAVYGRLDARATVQVGDGVTIDAGDLSVLAHNRANVDVSVYTVSRDRDWDFAVAITEADVAAEATIAQGANLQVPYELVVQAINENQFSTGATVMSLSQGKGGIAFAYARPETRAVASLGADVPGALRVVVDAWDITSRDSISASTTAGSDDTFIVPIFSYLDRTKVGQLLDKVGLGLDERSGVTEQPRLGSAVTVAQSSHDALAHIGEGAKVVAGELLVLAEVEHAGVKNHAESSVNSPGASNPREPDTSKGFSAAIVYGNYRQNAQAWIGSGADVSVARLGLRSRSSVPYQATWNHWDSVSDITAKINGNLGLAGGYLTGFANSTGAAEDLSVAGSVSVLSFDTTSLAYVDRGAAVNQIPMFGDQWTTERPGASVVGRPQAMEWGAPIDIQALSDVAVVSGVGHLGLTFNALETENPGGKAVGANYGQLNVSTATKAYLAAGAKIEVSDSFIDDVPGKVSLSAVSREQLYLIVPTAGRSMGEWGFSGNFALTRLNTNTEASVDNTASVETGQLKLRAEDTLSSLAIAGGFGRAQQESFGASIAIQAVDNRVRAFIGDNGTRGDDEYQQGTVRVQALGVEARGDGKVETVSVASALVDPPAPKEPKIGNNLAPERLEDAIELADFRAADAAKKLEDMGDAVSLDGDSQLPSAQPPAGGQPQRPQFGFGISGSVSYNEVTLTTEAFLAGASVVITPQGAQPAAESGQVALLAVSDTHVVAGSGGGAFMLGRSGERGDSALAGAAAVNEITNTVQALVSESRVVGAPDLSLSALAGGDQVAVGIGLAVNMGTDNELAATVAGSVSVNLARNTVRAAVEGLDTSSQQASGEGGADGGSAQGEGASGGEGGTEQGGTELADEAVDGIGRVEVTAYNRIRIQAGAGSLAAGGEGGVGAGVTYNEVHNTTEAAIRDAGLRGAGAVTVQALTGTRIAAGGGMSAFVTDVSGGSGAGAFVLTFVDSDTAAVIEDSTVTGADSVAVEAADVVADAALDAIIDARDCTGEGCPPDDLFDFGGDEVRDLAGAGDGDTRPGQASSIVAVAGVLQGGTNNVGISLAYSEIEHSVTATVRNSEIESGGDVTVGAYSAADIFSLSAGAGIAAGQHAQFAGAGSVTVNKITTTTAAAVEAGGDQAVSARNLTVQASDQAKGWTLAGQVSASAGQFAAGLAIAHQEVAKTTSARLAGVDVEATGAVTVSANSQAQLDTFAAAAGLAQGNAVAGSSASSVVRNTTLAEVAGGTSGQTGAEPGASGQTGGAAGGDASEGAPAGGMRVTASSLSVQAVDNSTSVAGAGKLGLSRGGGALGGAVAVQLTGNNTASRVVDAAVATTGAMEVMAHSGARLTTAAVAGDFAQGITGSGSVAWSEIGNSTEAVVEAGDDRTVQASRVTVSAVDDSVIGTGTGQLAVSTSGPAAGGVAVTYAKIANKTNAAVRHVTVKTPNGAVAVEAAGRSRGNVWAVTGAYGGWSVGVAVAVARVANDTLADVLSAEVQAGKLAVEAKDESELEAAALQLALTPAGNEAGAAVAHAEIGGATRARLLDAAVQTPGTVRVAATGASRTDVTASGLGIAGKGVAAGSAASTTIANTIEAVAGRGDGSLSITPDPQWAAFLPSVEITATDASTVSTRAGGFLIGQTGAGAAVAVNRIGNTTRAHLDGTGSGAVSASDVLVQSTSAADIQVLAAGVALAGRSGGAGSSSTNFIDNRTESIIDNGAVVTAENDVGVIAESHDVIANVAGAAGVSLQGAGIGLSISVNEIGGHTLAAIRGTDTQVTALAQGGQGLEVASGRLREDIDLKAAVDWGSLDPAWRPPVRDLRETERVRGVAVNASSTHSIQAITINAGAAAGVSVAGNTTTNIVKGSTRALVEDGAKVNLSSYASQAGTAQSVSVKASDHAYSHGLVGALGTGGGAGAGVAVLVNAFSRGVEAAIRGSQEVRATDKVAVDARATQGVSAVALGIGLTGAGAGAGTVNVATFTGSTTAYVEDATVASKDVTVNADQTHRLFYATPASLALGLGGSAAAATISVGVMTGTSRAYIAGSSVSATGSVAVNAAGRSEIDNWSLGAAGSAATALAGNVAVNVIATTTESYVKETSIGSAGQRAQSVSVTARDDVSVTGRAGAFGVALGGVGVGASLVVTSIRNDTSVRLEDASVYASGDVDLDAQANRKVDALGAGGALASQSAIGGVLALTLIGQHISSTDAELLQELDQGGSGTLSEVQRQATGDRLAAGQGAAGTSIGVTDEERAAVNSASKVDVSSRLTSAGYPHGVSAVVSGATIVDTQGGLQVRAEETVDASTTAGAGAGAVFLSIGGSVGVTRATMNAAARVDGGASLTARWVNVTAAQGRDGSSPAIKTASYQGSAGVATLGAAVAETSVKGGASAHVAAGASIVTTEGLTLRARDLVNVEAHAQGYTGGLAALGLVSAQAVKEGDTVAVAGGAGGTAPVTTVRGGGLEISAERRGAVTSFGRSGSGGVVGTVTGVVAGAKDAGTIRAAVGDNVTVDAAAGMVRLEAAAQPQVDATVRGYSGSLLGEVGVGHAWAEAKPTVEATIGSGGSVTAGRLVVSARLSRDSLRPTVRSDAEATGFGGMILGVNASLSEATSDVRVHAGVNSTLNIAGDADVTAAYWSAQRAEASGIVGGTAALGFNPAKTSHTSSSTAVIGEGAQGTVGGRLHVNAAGHSDTDATAVAGVGGIVAGAGATADTGNQTVTRVEYGSKNGLTAKNVLLSASHSTVFDGLVNTVKSSMLGGSGAVARHHVNSVVETVLREGSQVTADQFKADAYNETEKPEIPGFNADGGSGGLLDGAAVSSRSDIEHVARVQVGKNAKVTVHATDVNAHVADFSAKSRITARDRTRLDAGGAIELAWATSIIHATSVSEVLVDTGAVVGTGGTVRMATGNDVSVSTSANAMTYGLASAAEGTSQSNVQARNMIRVGQGAEIIADGDIELYAGNDLEGNPTRLTALANTDLYNRTAVPMKTEPIADAVVEHEHGIELAAGSRLAAGGDVFLHSDKPVLTAEGKGYGKDLWRELVEEVANFFRRLVGASELSLAIYGGFSSATGSSFVHVDGRVRAGKDNKAKLVFDAQGEEAEKDPDALTYTIEKENLIANLLRRLAELRRKLEAYEGSKEGGHAIDAIEAEIRMVEAELQELGFSVPSSGDIPDYSPPAFDVEYIVISGVSVRGGDIHVRGQHLGGSGKLEAPNYATIIIENHGPRFLRIGDIVVENRGGHVYFNGVAVHDSSRINALNTGKRPAAQLALETIESSSSRPKIEVTSTYTAGSQGLTPDIEIVGDVRNLAKGGLLHVSSRGSIKLQGEPGRPGPTVAAAETKLEAARNLQMAYVDGLYPVGGDPKVIWQGEEQWSDEPRPGTGANIAGGKVFLGARYLLVNGRIQSGHPDMALHLQESEALQSAIADARSRWEERGSPLLSDHDDLRDYVIHADDHFVVYFNPATEHVVVDDVRIQGGYVELYGEILNTSGGKIEAMSGVGRIEITNELPYDLVLNTVDTGNIDGVVRITDLGKRTADGKVPTTVYRMNGETMIIELWQDGQLLESRSTDGRQSVYRPRENVHYVWVTGWELRNEYEVVYPGDGGFVMPGEVPPPWEQRWELGERYYGGETLVYLPTVEYTAIYPADSKAYEYRRTPENDMQLLETRNLHPCLAFICEEFIVWDRVLVVGRALFTHNARADYPIPIEFIGYSRDDASITNVAVSTPKALIIAGPIQHGGAGKVELTAATGAIRMGSDRGLVQGGGTIALDAVHGIGEAASPLRVDTLGAGSVLAQVVNGGIYLENPTGSLRVASVSAPDEVSLSAAGDITRVGAGVVTANRISLDSKDGNIYLAVQTGHDEESGVSATAAGHIALHQPSGDLRVFRVESLGGDVTLTVPNGAIVDANTGGERDERTIAELERQWEELMLIGDAADERAAATIEAFVTRKRAEYFRYWALLNVRPVLDDEGNVTGYAWDDYDPSTADEELRRLHESYGNTTYDPAWEYQLTEEEKTDLTEGVAWTREELSNSLHRGLLFKETGSTETTIRPPTVIGRNVTLEATRIGIDTDPIVIDLNDPDALLDDETRLAFLAAELDDVLYDEETGLVTVHRQTAVNVQASGELAASASGNIYLGSRAPLYVHRIESTEGGVRIWGTQGLYGSGEYRGAPDVLGGRIILEGGTGGIGTEERPLAIAQTTAAGLTARAEGDIFIRDSSYVGQSGKNELHVAEIFSRGTVSLMSEGFILDARGDRPIAIEGSSVRLYAYGDVGSAERPLFVLVTGTGGLTAESEYGGLWLVSPGGFELSARAATSIDIRAGAMVSVNRVEAAYDNVRLAAAGGLYGLPTSEARGHVYGFDVVLDGGAGGIGSADAPLRLDVKRALWAQAQEDIFVEQRGPDLLVGQIASQGRVHLTAGSRISQLDPAVAVAVEGTEIILIAAEDVGSVSAYPGPLTVRALKGGRVNIQAGRSVAVHSPETLRLGDVTAPLSLKATAGQDLELWGRIVSPIVVLQAGGSVQQLEDPDRFGPVGFDTNLISIESGGDIHLPASSVLKNSNQAGELYLTANGSIYAILSAKSLWVWQLIQPRGAYGYILNTDGGITPFTVPPEYAVWKTTDGVVLTNSPMGKGGGLGSPPPGGSGRPGWTDPDMEDHPSEDPLPELTHVVGSQIPQSWWNGTAEGMLRVLEESSPGGQLPVNLGEPQDEAGSESAPAAGEGAANGEEEDSEEADGEDTDGQVADGPNADGQDANGQAAVGSDGEEGDGNGLA